jgi:plastocyanin
MKRLAALLFLAATVAAAGAAAASPPTHQAQITIRHQTSHCHAWALGSGAYAAHLNATIEAGGTITIKNDDLMSHRLTQQGGPPAVVERAPMSHFGATATVRFPRAGVYRFRTIAGEDYAAGVETTGADNVLTLKVVVR